MKKVEDIFSKSELAYLSKKRSDLTPLSVPSRNDAKILTNPSLDQIIVKFLKQYEVNVEPKAVGEWNGWDTFTAIRSFYPNRGASNIASTIFMSNRSNQLNSIAEDWGKWKRWALDHKKFPQFQEEIIQTIDIHNKKVLKEIDEQIEKAELNNQNIRMVLKEPEVQKIIAEYTELSHQNLGIISFICSILGLICFRLLINFSNSAAESALGLLVLLQIVINLCGIGTGLKFLFTNAKKKQIGITGTILSIALLIMLLSLYS